MENKRIALLIQKLNSGQISQEEKNELQDFWEWANQNEDLFNSLSEMEKKKISMSMLTNIRSAIATKSSTHNRRRFLSQFSWPARIAATILVGVLAFWVLYNPIQFIDTSTAYSEQRLITLPDGSSVILNGNSSIRFKESWNRKENREVWMEGEGFFDVNHTQDNQKFIVHTASKVDVQVLGTRFNVKLRRGKTEVMLESGKVQMNVNQSGVMDTILLKPGDLVAFENLTITKSIVNSLHYASWKENKLVLDQTPLIEVAKILEDTHGFQIEFRNQSLENRKLSGELPSGNVDDILFALEETLKIKIIKNGSRLIFN